MADETFEVVGHVSVDADDANQQLASVTQNLDDMKPQTDEASGGISALGIAFGTALGEIAVQALDSAMEGLKSLGEIITDSINEAAGEEMQMALVNNTIQDLGDTAAATSEEVVRLAEGLGQTTAFGHDAALAGEQILLHFTSIGRDIFPQVTSTAADLAAGAGVGLTAAMRMLGRSLENPSAGMNTLRRYNVMLTDAQKELIKKLQESGDLQGAQQVILDAVAKSYGGAAAAAGGTYKGQLAILDDTFSQLKETIGGAFLPILKSLISTFHDFVSNPLIASFFTTLAGNLDRITAPFVFLIQLIGQLDGGASGIANLTGQLQSMFGDEMGGKIASFVTSISTLFSGLTSGDTGKIQLGVDQIFGPGGFAQIQSVFGTLQTIFNNLYSFWQVASPAIFKYYHLIFDGLIKIIGDLIAKIVPFVSQVLVQISGWFKENAPLINSFVSVMGKVMTAVFGVLGSIVQAVWKTVQPILQGIIDLVLGIAKIFMQMVTGDWKGAWETLKTTAVKVGKDLWNAVVGLLEGIAEIFHSSLDKIGKTWSADWALFKEIVMKLWNVFKEDVDIVVKKFIQVGTAIVDGIKSGVSGAWDSFVTWIKGLVAGVVDVVKKFFGISSPSAVFADIGANLMAGLQQGISGSINLPTMAITQAVNATVGAASVNLNGGGGGGARDIVFNITESRDARDTAQQIGYLLKLNGIQPFTVPVQR
jgi:phage-related protein